MKLCYVTMVELMVACVMCVYSCRASKYGSYNAESDVSVGTKSVRKDSVIKTVDFVEVVRQSVQTQASGEMESEVQYTKWSMPDSAGRQYAVESGVITSKASAGRQEVLCEEHAVLRAEDSVWVGENAVRKDSVASVSVRDVVEQDVGRIPWWVVALVCVGIVLLLNAIVFKKLY